MPRYAYRCEACNIEYLTMHGSSVIVEQCERCGVLGKLTKLLTMPSYTIKKHSEKKIGELTEEFIQDSRRDLKKQRDDLDKKR